VAAWVTASLRPAGAAGAGASLQAGASKAGRNQNEKAFGSARPSRPAAPRAAPARLCQVAQPVALGLGRHGLLDGDQQLRAVGQQRPQRGVCQKALRRRREQARHIGVY
jgi:hypothetical protein